MKSGNVTLQNTPLLINNICKSVYLQAPSFDELKEKVQKYQLLLVRCLTNTYQLSNLQMDRKYMYAKLPDGNYQMSIFISFSGKKKEEITNPEKTLEYIKNLTELEAKSKEECGKLAQVRHIVKNYHNTLLLPIEIKEGENETNVISDRQYQFLEKLLIEGKDIIKVSFTKTMKIKKPEEKTTIISLKVYYDYRDVVELPSRNFNPAGPGER